MKQTLHCFILFFCITVNAFSDESLKFKYLDDILPTYDTFSSEDELECCPDSAPKLEYFNKNNPWLCLKAIQFSYEEVISISYDSELDDWFIIVNGTKLNWADGKLLKTDELEANSNFLSFINYFYDKNLFDPDSLTKEEIELLKPKSFLKQRLNIQQTNTSFFSVIYGDFNKQTMTSNLEEVNVFGSKAYLHKRVADNLNTAIKQILKHKTKPEIKAFLKNFRQAYGFNWRKIADSHNPSNHSWGTAIDFMAKDYHNLKVYWFWEASTKDYWMMFKPNQRWKPPDAIIDEMEKQGFIWGGYWNLWDTMHFEFRPELIYIMDFFQTTEPHKFRKKNKLQ